jgi:hypothetical protein
MTDMYMPPSDTWPSYRPDPEPIPAGTLQLVNYPYKYAFAGNPMVFGMESDTPDTIVVDVRVGDGETFYFSLFPYGTATPYRSAIDISGFVRSHLYGYTEAGGLVMPVENFATDYRVWLNDMPVFTGTAFRGGISNSMALQLAQEGYTNIFGFRLTKYTEQFLFTTRTHSNVIRLRDTELSPFVFLHPGRAVSFISSGGNTIDTQAVGKGTPCTMNIKAIRAAFTEQYGELPDMIKVSCLPGYVSFRFEILPSVRSEEKYLIRFLNSLGTFEHIEVTGKIYNTPEFGEENKYESMNDLGFYEENRERVSVVKVYEAEAGYKTKQELDFILDMIQSDEIYFDRPDGYTCRCLVTADNVRYRHRMVEPGTIPLKIREVTGSAFAGPDEPTLSPLLMTEGHKQYITTENDNRIKI